MMQNDMQASANVSQLYAVLPCISQQVCMWRVRQYVVNNDACIYMHL